LGKSALEKTQDAALEVKARFRNHGSHFEPLTPLADNPDDDEAESSVFGSGRTESQLSSTSTASSSQMTRDEESQCIQERLNQFDRLQKQTGRAQQRSNIRARYGLEPDMLDTAFVLGSKMLMRKDNNAKSVRSTSTLSSDNNNCKRLMFW